MSILKKKSEKVEFEGHIFQLNEVIMTDGKKEKIFEIARRSPGVRLVIHKKDKILLTREYRYEFESYDYGLPGGKVFNNLADYLKADPTEMPNISKEAAKRECQEETGIIPTTIKHIYTSKAGTTIEWDLIYFLVEDFEETISEQELELGENIEICWKTITEVKEMCKGMNFREDRSVSVLYKFVF